LIGSAIEKAVHDSLTLGVCQFCTVPDRGQWFGAIAANWPPLAVTNWGKVGALKTKGQTNGDG